MTTEFYSTQEALNYLRAILGLGPEVSFKKIETEPIGGFGSELLITAAC
jgi:hypothetical protein